MIQEMKDRYPGTSLSRICRLLGVSRQAYYQHLWRQEFVSIEQEMVLKEVLRIRENHRYIGTRKLYEMVQPLLREHQIKMGRDALFDLLEAHHLLVRRRKRRVSTTDSAHWLHKYPNLVKGFVPTAPNQLWVSDITYWRIAGRFLYISFITDAYSHKIVGYQVAESLEAVASVQALKMALLGLQEPHGLYHHSDRGVQYCSEEYVRLLSEHRIRISMSETGDPLDNAIAERVNGIIKNEYLCSYQVEDIQQARQVLGFVIGLYNEQRPHMSNGNLTPQLVHEKNLKTEKLWKSYYRKNTKLVNPCQDEKQNVNLKQD